MSPSCPKEGLSVKITKTAKRATQHTNVDPLRRLPFRSERSDTDFVRSCTYHNPTTNLHQHCSTIPIMVIAMDVSTTSTAINHILTPQEIWQIATLAVASKRKAYCPYSNFRVGAAILVEEDPDLDTNLYTGANVEVASTPVGTCAERCALAPLVASIERPSLPKIRALAVSTDIWPPASPCGMYVFVDAFLL